MFCTNKAAGVPAWLAFLAGAAASSMLSAAELNLVGAEVLALQADPSIQSVEANRQALDEMAVAARQLPDPMLKIGVMSLPTDSFDLRDEPMTQAQIGLVQTFPRGKTRALRSEQISLRSAGLQEALHDQELQVVLAVREQFLEVVKQLHLAKINADARAVFSELVDITQDYYATGRVHQQDVLQASVELAKVEDRATRIAQAEEQARTRLATWVGDAAYTDIQAEWPHLDRPSSPEAVKEGLGNHPRILAIRKNVSIADTGMELARQNYKPEFSLDLTYGGRAGTSPDGSSRPDLLSLMLVMDLPLFHNNRQDRVMAAQAALASAASFDLDDAYRHMRSELEFTIATYEKQQQRVDLFEHRLLPEAASSAEASYEAYQSAVQDLTTLLRARITEFDLQLEHAGLQADVLASQAHLLYLEGKTR